MSYCSYAHSIAPKGKFIAFVSTEAETDKPEIELKPGIDLLGPVEETFFDIYDRYEPANNPENDSCFVTIVSASGHSFYIQSDHTVEFLINIPSFCRATTQPLILRRL